MCHLIVAAPTDRRQLPFYAERRELLEGKLEAILRRWPQVCRLAPRGIARHLNVVEREIRIDSELDRVCKDGRVGRQDLLQVLVSIPARPQTHKVGRAAVHPKLVCRSKIPLVYVCGKLGV